MACFYPHKPSLSIFLYFCLSALCFLTSCAENEVLPEEKEASEFLIIGDNDYVGVLSSFVYPSGEEIQDILSVERVIYPTTFSDIVVKENQAFAVSQAFGTVFKIDLNDKQVEKIQDPENELIIRSKKTIRIVNEELVIAYSKYVKGESAEDPFFASYLKTFDTNDFQQTDSLFIEYDYFVSDMITVNNKIFISLIEGSSRDQSILVLDAITKNEIGRIPLEEIGSELYIYSGEKLLVIGRGEIYIVNTNILTVEESIKFQGETYIERTANMTAFDKENNLLYYFRATAQPAPTPFVLASLDLKTKETKLLTDLDLIFDFNSTMLFDEQQEKIVIASGTDLLFLDTKGNLIREIELPFLATKVIKR